MKENLPKWYYRLTLALVFTIPLSQLVSVRLLIILLVFSFFVGKSPNRPARLWVRSWEVFLYLLVLIVGVLYSADTATGLAVLETNFSLFAMPLAFSWFPDLDEKKLHAMLTSFVYGLCAACLVCIVTAIYHYVQTNDAQVFLFYRLTDVINAQPTYFAYYLIFGLTFLLYLLYFNRTGIRRVYEVLIIIFLFLVLMLTGSQTAFVSLLLIFSFFILKFLVEEKNPSKWLTCILVGNLVVALFLTHSFERESDPSAWSDSWERIRLWESAIDATPNLLLGTGTGDYRHVLNQYYISNDLAQFAQESFNSHNQLIQVLLSNGLVGVIAVLLMVGRPLYSSVKSQNVLGVLVFFPFLIYGITEVFLGRYQGIVFFAFLHQVFVAHIHSTDVPGVLKPR